VLQQQLIAGSEKENRCERQQLRRLINPAETPRTPNQNVFGYLGYIMYTLVRRARVSERGPGNVEHRGGDRVPSAAARADGKSATQDSPLRGCHAAGGMAKGGERGRP